MSLHPRMEAQQDPAERLNAIFKADNRKIFVAAHRGDWRDAPENSLPSLRWAAWLGVDIVEMDVKLTSDGQLIVMHDLSLDRTTTGSGPVSAHTTAEVSSLHLRAGTGHPTAYTVPTFAEELDAAREKGQILDVDQGWNNLPEVVKEVRAHGASGQVILNVFPNTPYDALMKRVPDISDDLTLMAIVNMARPDADNIIRSYSAHKRTIIQCIFADEQSEPVRHIADYGKQSPIWINSLWPDQNAGHDDDRAVDQGSEQQTWGWLIEHGARVIQTDRPRELMEYLKQKGLR
ncbi:glycerophosphodiester phosphodiesterase family protein [Silvibacterium acidisoli]|uniref:glycerophosphodiester phosphodiesterase family protein n=1 Tax=Acidobacteriaceae bacterium ZG23-2 TaxID=2883246 RepID=UPI00406CC99F